jgi:hypothetical protein
VRCAAAACSSNQQGNVATKGGARVKTFSRDAAAHAAGGAQR